uniref:Protein smoothened n=1 Tax=Lygus hesperus TaxID=30085 RepID=A0A0K8S5C7_LYGHE
MRSCAVFVFALVELFTRNAAYERKHHAFEQPVLSGGFFHKIANGEPARANPNNISDYPFKDFLFNQELNPFFNRFALPKEGISYCLKPAKCEFMNYTTCLGTKLPYNYTSLDLVDGVSTQQQAQEQLNEWQRLIHVPKCWAVIQPFLCALYMPRCDSPKGSETEQVVSLPSQEMCKMIQGPCRIVTTYEQWPSVFRCENNTRYPTMCKNDVRELKFNSTGQCMSPLVPTDHPSWFFEGVEGCGVQCNDPMFPDHDRQYIHKMVFGAASLCALFNLFAVLTFMIDWKFSSKYPALVIFYINYCFLMVCLGWLAQFVPGGREDIVCRKDGTLRLGEPSASENLSCVIVFVMVYYFLMAGVAWFVILTYACHISLQALGKIQECMEKKAAYFHMVAWSFPLVLTIATMALGEIDGNSVTGICFVGYANDEYRAGFLLVPVAIALAVGTAFLFKGLFTLIRLKVDSEDIISPRASSKIRETIFRMVVFSFLILIFGGITFTCHIYEFMNNEKWAKSFRIYVLCKLGFGPGNSSDCRMSTRPSLAMLQLHILSLFASGMLMSTWVWTRTTVNTWSRFFARLLNKEVDVEKQIKPKKHKLIAQAYSKRKELEEKSWKLSISFHSSHQDPVGLGFELNSGASGSVRSSWAAALPKFVTRRGALVAATNSSSSVRRNSVDSQISYSVRRVSVESRRHSVDSTVSVKLSEVTQTVVKKVSTPLHKHRGHHKSRTRKLSRTKKKAAKQARNSASASSNDSNERMAMLMLALAEAEKNPGSLKALGYSGSSQKAFLGRKNKDRKNAGLESDFALLTGKLFSNYPPTISSSSSYSSGITKRNQDIELDILKDIEQVEEFTSKEEEMSLMLNPKD